MNYEFEGKNPVVAKSALIQDGVRLEGEVIVKNNASIWYNSTLRADIAQIIIGENSNVQELTTIHVDYDKPTIVGDNVTVGHNCVLHGCTIGENSLIGMGSIILNGAEIGSNCLVGAGSVVSQNFSCESGMLVIGNPAVAKRPLKDSEQEYILKNTSDYVKLAQKHKI